MGSLVDDVEGVITRLEKRLDGTIAAVDGMLRSDLTNAVQVIERLRAELAASQAEATGTGKSSSPALPAPGLRRLGMAVSMLERGIERHKAGSSQADEHLDGALALLKEFGHADQGDVA